MIRPLVAIPKKFFMGLIQEDGTHFAVLHAAAIGWLPDADWNGTPSVGFCLFAGAGRAWVIGRNIRCFREHRD